MWCCTYLHAFSIGDNRYDPQFDDFSEDELDEENETVISAFRGHESFEYIYDFGDSWEHNVAIEDSFTTSIALKYAVCLDGAPNNPHAVGVITV